MSLTGFKAEAFNTELPKEYRGHWYISGPNSDEGIGFGANEWGYDTSVCVYLDIKQISKGKLKIRTACGPESTATKSEIAHISTLKDGNHNSKWNGQLTSINIHYMTLTLKGKTLTFDEDGSGKIVFKHKE